jgi:ribosome-binding factor A
MQEVGAMLQRLELPALITVSKVEVSPDLKHAKVFITCLPSDEKTIEQVLEIIGDQRYDLQGEINRKLVMRVVPRMHFVIDHSQEYASRINDLLRKANE